MIEYRDNVTSIPSESLTGFFVGWPNPPSPQTHLELLEQSDEIVIAIDDATGRAVGFVTAISDGVLSAYIPFLEVLPEYQNRGIGKELMGRLLDSLRKFYMVDLICNIDLQPYYEKLGMNSTTGMMIRNYDSQSGI